MSSDRIEIATLGGGCFWCLEAVYQEVAGVKEVVSGYAGGSTPQPSYYDVCSGRTGHSEVVQIRFDPDVVTYRELLEIFFVIHDPTTPNRQGADVGTQYRSIILYHDNTQKETAREVIAEVEAKSAYPRPVVTELAPLETFWRAEPEHQDYFRRNPGQGYCQFVIVPKLAKFRETFTNKVTER